MQFYLKTLVLLLAALGAVGLAAAQPEAGAATPSLAELEAMILDAKASADNAWILTSSVIVLMMTLPGLALFYGGLVRSKNVLSILMQCFFIASLASIVWFLYGYSFAFGAPGDEGNPFFGGFDKLLLANVSTELADGEIPEATFMIFQLMFAIITPALMVGAFAERLKFSALLPIVLLWLTIVYTPLAHMVWNDGFLSEAGAIPALDFAGGTVVHISSGVSALVIALYIGKRRGFPGNEFAPHSMVLTAIGAALLWVGWFGFNAGSELAAGGGATSAFIATQFSAAGAAFSWTVMEWIMRGKPSLLGAVSGVIAGLVGVTPAAGFVGPGAGLVIGLATGVLAYLAVSVLKPRMGYDDSLDVFGIHGVGGMVGAVLTGVFAREAIGGAAGLVEGNGMQVVHQALAVVVTIVLSVVATLAIVFVVDKLMGIRVSEEDELTGLDLVDHGESAYHQVASTS